MRLPINQIGFGDMVSTMGLGVATAQNALDDNAIKTVLALQSEWMNLPNGKRFNLLDLGFTPAFFQFSEVVFSLRITMSMTTEISKDEGRSKKRRGIFKSRSVNASHSSKYQFGVESASTLNARLLPRPAPETLSAKLNLLQEAAQSQKETARAS